MFGVLLVHILLTGATGLVGQELGLALARAGHSILVLTRDSKRAKEMLPFPARVENWDFVSYLNEGKIAGVDAVIHLAGESIADNKWTSDQKQKLYDSRVLSTKFLRESFSKVGMRPKVWLNASAIGYYADSRETEIFESGKRDEGFLGNLCRDWESEALRLDSDVRVVIFRIGVVLAKRGGFLQKMLGLFRYGAGGRIGDGKQYFSWISLVDLVSMCQIALTDTRYRGIYNATATPVTNAEFAKTLGQVLGKPTFMNVPQFALKTLMGESSIIALASHRVVPKRLTEIGFNFSHQSLADCLDSIIDFERDSLEFEFFTRQLVNRPLEEVFPFFSDEKNLETLTPDFLRFKVLRKSTPSIMQGTLIDYALRIKGVPVRWRTEIIDWNPPNRFVDLQLKGPYAKWHHTHEFEVVGGCTLMTDRVLYKAPLGLLGLTTLPVVNHDIQSIFSFRRKKIDEIFGERFETQQSRPSR